ncbi:hypothetical protein [Bacillus sp. PS06]|uniref:hypothetical protein n=1 Tax=Bacillus sp. PS06 TaxID=2764176 RepID=UPI0017823FF8|nr:hypothetical protein [Bacillus sp. PS06]MBD8070579.1 hypothetical protein [Bacillus sp. PS06]
MNTRFVLICFLILFIPILSACTITGENVLVYIDQTDKNEIIKVNAITKYDEKTKSLIVKAIMDVYDEKNQYLRTTLFHMDGSVENTVTYRHEEGAMTLLTDDIFKPKTINLNTSNQEKVKEHILKGISMLHKEKDKK